MSQQEFKASPGETFTHKQFGGTFEVKEADGARVRILSNRPGAAIQQMHVEQLFEHYRRLG